jgi:hypothetical protein
MPVGSLLSPYVLYPLGIFGALALIPILIVYLIKPKLKDHKLPSMVFLLEQKARKKRYRWLRFLPSNWLLYLHLLIALLITLAITNPFVLTPESETKDAAIHIIDVSASMHAGSRLQKALDTAKDYLSSDNTVIVISSPPYIGLEHATSGQTRKFLSTLKAQDTPTPLVSALTLAATLSPKDTAIHIYSDMSDSTENSDQMTQAIARLEGNNNIVALHKVQGGTNNVGIVDAIMDSEETTLLIRNYNNFATDITMKIGKETIQLHIPAEDVTEASFRTPQEPTIVHLEYNDDLPSDNDFYIASLPDITFPLLYITNDESDYTKAALSLLPFIAMSIYHPPGISNAEHERVFVFERADTTKILPSTVKKALDIVENEGGALILKMSEGMQRIDLEGTLPVRAIKAKKLTHISMSEAELVQGLTASSEEVVFAAEAAEDAIVLAQTSDGEAVIVMKQLGKGAILYYGIDDSYFKSIFKTTYAFPILLKRFLEETLHYPTLQQINRKTGSILTGNGIITFPDGRRAQLPALLSKGGLYQSGSIQIAANLLDPEESAIQQTTLLTETQEANVLFKEQLIPVGIARLLAGLIIILLTIELIVLKWRRDL